MGAPQAAKTKESLVRTFSSPGKRDKPNRSVGEKEIKRANEKERPALTAAPAAEGAGAAAQAPSKAGAAAGAAADAAKTAPPAASVEKTMSFMPGQVESHSYARTAHCCRAARRAAPSGARLAGRAHDASP